MVRQLEKIDLVYIDLGNETNQVMSKYYPVKLAGSIPGDKEKVTDKLFDIFLVGFYSHNLPDWTSWNEALLKFEIKYTPQKETASESKDATFSLDFRVKDSSSPGGFLHRRIFRKAKTGDELELKISLDEIDEKFDITKVTSIVTDTSIGEHLDLSGYTQYINLGTEIYNKIADLAVKDDPIWGKQIVLKAKNYFGGAAALKHGLYALVATTDSKGNNLRNWETDYSNVYYKGKHLHIGEKEEHLKTNYLIFALDYS